MMKKTLAALALISAMTPGFALAQGCGHERSAQISCAEGQNWDAVSQSCVTVGS